MRRIAATVTGRVQGVGFRYFVRSVASRYGLSGWVRNMSDGSVSLEAQGGEPAVIAFVKELRKGPPLSHVSDIAITEEPAVDGEAGFTVRH